MCKAWKKGAEKGRVYTPNICGTNMTDKPFEELGAVGGLHDSKEETSRINTNFKCEPCLFENIEKEASTFCMDCSEHLCASCAREHRKNKLSRDHKLFEGEDISDKFTTIAIMKKMMHCPDHPDTVVMYKCEDHEKYICVTCLAECHRKCNTVNEIAKAKTPVNENMNARVEKTLSQLQDTATASKRESEENISTYKDQLAKVQLQQQSLLSSIYEKLSQAKANLESETLNLVTKEVNDHERNLTKCKETCVEGQEFRKVFEFVMKFGNSVERSVIPNLILSRAEDLYETIKAENMTEKSLIFETTLDMETIGNIANVSMVSASLNEQQGANTDVSVSSDEIPRPVHTLEEKAESSVHLGPSKCNATTQTDEMALQTGSLDTRGGSSSSNITQHLTENVKIPSLMKRNINQLGVSYKVRCPGDKARCKIYALEILPDERLIMIDKANTNLKLFTEHFSLVFTKGLHNVPFYMCHVNDKTVAVSFEKSIETYDIETSNAHKVGHFLTKTDVCSLAKVGDVQEIAILFEESNKPFIQIRNARTGRIFKTVNFENSCGVPYKFGEDGCLRLLYKGAIAIIVSEFEKLHCYKSASTTGYAGENENVVQESWFYKSRDGSYLKFISYLTADDEGNIYVCGRDSYNVHQISKDDYRRNRIIISNIKKPLSVGVNSKRGYVVIGCHEDDYIHVYNFC
ncbi:E3 ubiquitin-protein ligase TRIM56-like [Ruditapes philippinarum]|uniref:E3 ubiquitin-protein ligase TRIM56-like n=1 Tax=Ruditapes philippinarum TaxID=129788 RepID=UPI00295A70FB|nr:E3 ubiquitin-protein ligase TRIM56-like [Ruditapes philippinarum]